jgi:hypothetical protein
VLALNSDLTRVTLSRLSLTSGGVKAGEGGESTGHLGVRSLIGQGGLKLEDGSGKLFVGFEGLLSYDALTRRVGRQFVPPDRHVAPVQSLKGSLDGLLTVTGEGVRRQATFSGRLQFRCPFVGVLHLVRSFQLEMTDKFVEEAPLEFRRLLKIRPVYFYARDDDPQPTGSNAQAQFDAAQRIWSKCCIDLDVLTPERRVNRDLKVSPEAERVANSWDDPDKDTIEVFFVDNPLANYAGGAAFSCGWNQAKVVLTDDNECTPHLLAHELGHVLAGVHPLDTAVSIFWQGDIGTVMEGILQPCDPIPERNTENNCVRAHNPALESLIALPCRFTSDK